MRTETPENRERRIVCAVLGVLTEAQPEALSEIDILGRLEGSGVTVPAEELKEILIAAFGKGLVEDECGHGETIVWRICCGAEAVQSERAGADQAMNAESAALKELQAATDDVVDENVKMKGFLHILEDRMQFLFGKVNGGVIHPRDEKINHAVVMLAFDVEERMTKAVARLERAEMEYSSRVRVREQRQKGGGIIERNVRQMN